MYIYVILLILFSMLIGASFPSFFLVLKYRKEAKQDNNGLSGRSYCNQCKTPLKWYNLIPIFSYIIQQGECKNCGFKIPKKYFYYELLGGSIGIIISIIIMYSLNY